jgi:hypothetical protein
MRAVRYVFQYLTFRLALCRFSDHGCFGTDEACSFDRVEGLPKHVVDGVGASPWCLEKVGVETVFLECVKDFVGVKVCVDFVDKLGGVTAARRHEALVGAC